MQYRPRFACRFAVLVSLLASLLAGSQVARAYTINTTELGKRIRWAQDTVEVRMEPELEAMLRRPGDAYASIQISLEAWRGLPRVPDLVLRAGDPSALGHHPGAPSNGIYLLRDWPYEAEKLAVTIITYEMESGRLLDADIVVNGEAPFDLLDERMPREERPDDRYDLAAVLTHEVGHMLGLGESQDDPDATMWPYAVPGETEKRTLSRDDEDGVIASYLGAPPAPATGCGPMSIGGRARTSHVWLFAFAFGVVLWRPSRRLGQRISRPLALLLGLSLLPWLFAFDANVAPEANDARARLTERFARLADLRDPRAREALAAAARSADPELRMLSSETLSRIGTRDDLELAERLAVDPDSHVSRSARRALGALLARTPIRTIEARSIEGQAQLARLRVDPATAFVGHVEAQTTRVEDGRLFTEYRVRDREQNEAVLVVPGGSLNGVAQRVLHTEPPPLLDAAPEAELLVAPQPDGSQRWTYVRDGHLFGGSLGHGPAIAGAL